MWKFLYIDYVPEDKSEIPNVSIQEEYHLSHAPWEGNSDLSYAQSESNVDNEFKDIFKEPPQDVHEYFIECGHDENIAVGSQWPQPVYTNLKEECQHGINKNDDKSTQFTYNFQDVDFSYGIEFNEEKVFAASK